MSLRTIRFGSASTRIARATRIPGGETMAEAQTRMVNELESLRAKHEGETVAMV